MISTMRYDMLSKGIEENQIINYEDYKNIPYNLICYLCDKLVNNPVECPTCNSLYCLACWNDHKEQQEMKCIMNCNSDVIKADPIILLSLNTLKLRCLTCNIASLNYSDYNTHFSTCYSTHLQQETDEHKDLTYDKHQILSLPKSHIKSASINREGPLTLDDFFQIHLNHDSKNKVPPTTVDKSNRKNNRKKIMTYGLSPSNKMRMYNAVMEGDLEKFKEHVLINKFPLFEEISSKGYHWSALHYAMHNGRLNIIYFIFDTLIAQGELELALECETNDARCPLLCLLNSDKLNLKEKREIFIKLMHNYEIKIPDRIFRACKKRGYLECLMMIKSKSKVANK